METQAYHSPRSIPFGAMGVLFYPISYLNRLYTVSGLCYVCYVQKAKGEQGKWNPSWKALVNKAVYGEKSRELYALPMKILNPV